MNISNIQKYGLILLNKYNLVDKRKQIKFNNININDFKINNENNKNIIEKWIIKLLEPYISNIKKINFFIRELTYNKELKFHIDDCQLITKNKSPLYNLDSYIYINNNKYLYHQNILPNYTCILYFTDFDKDFKGGELVFSDNITIKPYKGIGILFDSREAHMVKPITKGTRISLVIKIYL